MTLVSSIVNNQSSLGRRQGHPTPVLLPGKSHGRRSLVGSSVHGVAKSQTRLSDFPFTFHFHALEKEMATHSSILAWRIPGWGSLVGCRLWGRTESDMTEATQQQQQQSSLELKRQTCHRISSASPLTYLQSDETIGGYNLLKLENKPKQRKNKILEIGNPIRKKGKQNPNNDSKGKFQDESCAANVEKNYSI